MLDYVDTKRHIVTVAARNIKLVVTDPEVAPMFHKLVREITCEVAAYLRKGNRNPKKLLALFSGFRVSFDPRKNWKYRTDGNAFVINLLSLLYTPPWRLASVLVHEAEHVLFLKRKGMINAPESEQERFGEKFTRDMEIRAVKAERDFLLTIKRHVPPAIHVFVTAKKHRHYPFDDVLSKTIRTLRALETDKDTKAIEYNDDATRNATSIHAEIAAKLNVQPPSPDHDEYEEVTMEFNEG